TSAAEMPQMLKALLHLRDSAGYPSRSELLYAFIVGAVRHGASDDVITMACLDEAHRGCAIREHVRENGDFSYLSRQVDKIRGNESQSVLDPRNPMPSARKIVLQKFTADDKRTLWRHRGTFWTWAGSHYRLANDETMAAEVWSFLDAAKRQTENGRVVPF